jgi:SPFH domain / Band 7 family
VGVIGRFFGGLLVVVLVIWGLGIALGALESINKVGPTSVEVVRNGGIFDNRDIREVRPPSAGVKVSGLYSEGREYIAGNENRFYRVSSDPSLGKQSGADFIQVPTKDGVNVEIDAQLSFRTNFTNEDGEITPCEDANGCNAEDYEALVEKFDTAYGNRNFTSKTGGTYKPWEGNNGWNAFLDSIFRPVVENAFREQIGAVNCSDLVSSCALVQSSVQGQEANVKFTPKDNQSNFEAIQKQVQERIESGVSEALGSEYLTGFKVQLTKVTLPESVQQAIDAAQSNFAQIAESRARKEQAQYQAEANEILSKSYKNNPTLGFIKAVEAVSKNSNATIILGEPGTGLTLGKKP